MARTELPFIAQTQSGAVVQGASAQINKRVGGAATVYATETGISTLPNPITTGLSGRIDGWLEEGQYVLVVSGPGITTYSQPWDVRSGGPISRWGNTVLGNVGPANQGGIGLGSDPSDLIIYRSAAATARVNGTLIVDNDMSVGQAKIVGTSESVAFQNSLSAGIFKINFAPAFIDNNNTQRIEVGSATDNDSIISGLNGDPLQRLGISATGIVIQNNNIDEIVIPVNDSFRIGYEGGRDTLHLSSTVAETGITIGGDVEVFRASANVLKTPDTFDANTYLKAGSPLASTHLSDSSSIGKINTSQTWTSVQTYTADIISNGADIKARSNGDTFDRVRLGYDGYIYFGSGTSAYDVTLRRSAPGVLRSSGTFESVGGITASIGGVNQVALGVGNPSITLNDTAITRTAAGALTVGGALSATGDIIAKSATPDQVYLSNAGVYFHNSLDTIIQRTASGVITITNDIIVRNLTVTGTQTSSSTQTSVGSLTAAFEDVGQVRIGNVGNNPTIYFGPTEDTTLFRDGANKLHTNDELQVDGALLATSGATVSGAPLIVNRTTSTDSAITVQGTSITRLRILGNGTFEWADTSGSGDTNAQLTRTAAGVIASTGILSASGFRVGATSLASTHLSDSGSIARLASPTFTGTVTTPVLNVTTRQELPIGSATNPSLTFVGNTNTGTYSPGLNQIALSTNGVARLTINSSGAVTIPGALTVGGLSPILSDDARLINSRIPTGIASGMLSGNYPDPSIANASITNTHISTTAAIVDTKLATIATAGKVADTAISANIARLVSPTFTGLPGAPTAPVNTNTTQLATTAFVAGQAASIVSPPIGTAAVGTSLRYARQDHIHAGETGRAPIDNPSFTTAVTVNGPLTVNGNTRLGSTAANSVGFFDVAGSTKKIGYGAGTQIGTKGALSASSTLNDVIANLSSLVADLRAYGLIGA